MPLTAALSPQSQKRLAVRRGSATAHDPFNLHANLNQNPERVSSSTLTIVRVVPPPVTTPPPSFHEPPSPGLTQRRLHRRPVPAQGNSPGSPQASSEANSQPPPRLSFASTSFSGAGSPSGHHSGPPSWERSQSPTTSPRLRPSSPRLNSSSSPFSSKPRLTPDQVVDLARQSTSPLVLAQAASTPHSLPSSPGGLLHSPVISPHSPHLNPSTQPAVAPATFTPLPDDIYLPFLDRPGEVASLISSPPDAKLFTLLAQTFPKKNHDQDDDRPIEKFSDLPIDPAHWTYRHLIFLLTQVDRDVAPDAMWAYAARKCIMSRSELIWERVKGALGIPPELDIDFDFKQLHDRGPLKDDETKNKEDNGDIVEQSSNPSSVATSDISDDEGRAARGHWSDWDAILDSPIAERGDKRFSNDSLSGPFSPTHISGYEHEHEDYGQVSIEPIVVTPATPASVVPSVNPPPLSLPSSLAAAPVASDGLGDIAEGEEEENEYDNGNENKDGTGNGDQEKKASETGDNGESERLDPAQIQGLKISTSPLPVTHFESATSPLMLPPPSHEIFPAFPQTGTQPLPIPGTASTSATVTASATPVFGSADAGVGPGSAGYMGSRPHSRTSSFSSIGPFRRTDSSGSLTGSLMGIRSSAMGGYTSGSEADSGSALSELPLGNADVIGFGPSLSSRSTGHPLFPSNFARLGNAPTLFSNTADASLKRSGSASTTVSSGGGKRRDYHPKRRTYSHGEVLKRSGSGLKSQSWGAGGEPSGANAPEPPASTGSNRDV